MKLETLSDLEKLRKKRKYSVFRVEHRMPFRISADISEIASMRKGIFKRRLYQGYVNRQPEFCEGSDLISSVFVAPIRPCRDVANVNEVACAIRGVLDKDYEMKEAKVEPGKAMGGSPLALGHRPYFDAAELSFSQPLASFELPFPFEGHRIDSCHLTKIYVFPTKAPNKFRLGYGDTRVFIPVSRGLDELHELFDW